MTQWRRNLQKRGGEGNEAEGVLEENGKEGRMQMREDMTMKT